MERQNQEPVLPENNEDVINVLGLDGHIDINSSKLLDDIVSTLGLDGFTITPASLIPLPVAAIGFENVQGQQQQLIGNALGPVQPCETISYIDLSPAAPSGVESSPFHGSGGCVFINDAITPPASPHEVYSVSSDAISPPASPQEVKSVIAEPISPPASPQVVSSFVPTTSVENEDARKPAGGKTTKRRRELKPKLYEREEPLDDPVEEKKRLNAINAKRNRELKKSKQQELEDQVKALIAERDTLQASNTKLSNKCESFEQQLKKVCKQFNVPVIILPE